MRNEEQKQKHKESNRRWNEKNHDKKLKSSIDWQNKMRKKGWTKYCPKDYEKIQNYELALVDEFNNSVWVCHHLDEAFYKQATLKKRKEYYNIPPEKLIWLHKSEHDADKGLSTKCPDKSHWHKRIYDR